MQKHGLKNVALLLCLLLPAIGQQVKGVNLTDGFSPISVKEAHVSNSPKGSTILATINGHTLSIVFTENLGQVNIEITTATGSHVDCMSTATPDGIQFYIPLAGDYIVTFTLSNGDEYYGEFTVTD